MYVLGLTGGLGAGKSTASELLEDRGAVVIDLDDVAKRLLDESAVVRERVTEVFGEGVLDVAGHVDHAALAKAAFGSDEAAAKLDGIMHPAVYAAVAGALDLLAMAAQPPRAVVLVIPLLAEAPEFLDLTDAVVAISAPEDVRLERALARGMSAEDAEARIARQVGDGERRAIADYTIENDSDIDTFRRDLARFWEAEVAARGA
jgi:dephospho-CoA kinase